MTLIQKIMSDYGINPSQMKVTNSGVFDISKPFTEVYEGKPGIITLTSDNVRKNGIDVKISLSNGRTYHEHYSYEDAVKEYSKHKCIY